MWQHAFLSQHPIDIRSPLPGLFLNLGQLVTAKIKLHDPGVDINIRTD
jgi:hypothetical protein